MTTTDRIETKRLVLRRFEPADASALHAIMSDPGAMQFWSTLQHVEIRETEAWLARTIDAVNAGESDDFAVVHNGALSAKPGCGRATNSACCSIRKSGAPPSRAKRSKR